MIVCFLLQAIFVHQSFSYTKSVVGHPGTDTVQTQEFDSYEILEEVSKPSNIKSVSELHALHPDRYPEIAESDYGWQGHNPTDANAVKTEATAIKEDFCKNSPDLTQDELYAHPVGVEQLYGDKELISNAKRYKVRYIFNPNYAEQHTTALYVPPGELITIELPEKHANGVSITVNNHAENVDDVTRTPRYPILGCTTKISITGRVTKFGWPLGGNLVFSFGIDKYTNNFEVNISGVILSPYFRYGSTTDEEWEDTIRQYPGPYTFLDTGAVHIQLPSSTIRSATQLNDAMAFLRGVSVITYSGGEIAYNDRRSDGRVRNPNYWYLDSYVRVGEAYAVQGANIVRAPNYWSGSIVNYNSQRQGCWGTIHEYGHHFQDWGFERYGEASNNIYAIITYSLYTPISSTRTPNGDGTMSATSNDGWSYVTHQNGILNYEGGNVVLTLYANLMYAFGQEKTLEIIHADRYNTYYYHSDGDSTTLTRPARYFMTACKVLQRNLIPYFNSYASLIAAANLNDTTYYKEESLEEVRKAGYKEFHPIGLVYQCGYIVDGEETETSRPYQVPAGETTRLYFKRDILTRAKYGMHDFEFVRYYGGENATFDLVDEGTYDYTPKGTLLNKFYVVYRDVVNKEETTCIVKIQPTVQFGETFSYYNIDFKSGNLTHGFNSIQDKEYEDKYLTTGIKINNNLNYSTLPWLCINKGKIVPRQSGTYVFYMKHDEEAAFYISEHELKGNPTDDAPYLILILNEWHTNYNTNYPSEEIRLEEGKEYYYQFVMQNADGDGGGSVGYRIKDSNGNFNSDSVIDVSQNMIVLNGYGSTEIIDFVPTIPTFSWNFDYKGTNSIIPSPDNFTFSKYPPLLSGEGINNSVNGGQCDSCRTRAVSEVPFPQEFEIDFAGYTSFNEIVLGSNKNTFKMNSTIELRCDNETIYFGHYTSDDDDILFDRSYTCSKLQLYTYNNTETWMNGNPGGTSIRKIEFKQSARCKHIVPITHSQMKISEMTEQRAGVYYNGKGYIGRSKGEISFEFRNTSNIGIIGDLYEYGGSAKVYLDDEEIGTFDTSKMTTSQKNSRANGAETRLYMSLLFIMNDIDAESVHELKISDIDGEVAIAGFITDDGVLLSGEGSFTPAEEGSKSLSDGAIAGIVIAVLIVVAIIVVATIIVLKKMKKKDDSSA